jgi:lipopolysaccharide export system ATP-binding protein
LTEVRNNPAARCSGGEKRRLEIARCLVCEPLLILLDEPLAAVDPLTKEDIRKNIRMLANQGILLTDHDVREVLKIADRAYLIIGGRVVAHGTPAELKRNKVAIDGYLGDTFSDEGFTKSGIPPQHTPPRQFEPSPAIRPRSFQAEVPAHGEVDAVVPLSSADVETQPNPLIMSRQQTPLTNTQQTRVSSSASTQLILEQEKIHRLVDQLLDRNRMSVAWKELSNYGSSALPVLIEALERRELELRHLAHRLLETITGDTVVFQSDASEDIRMRQIALLRAKYDKRA